MPPSSALQTARPASNPPRARVKSLPCRAKADPWKKNIQRNAPCKMDKLKRNQKVTFSRKCDHRSAHGASVWREAVVIKDADAYERLIWRSWRVSMTNAWSVGHAGWHSRPPWNRLRDLGPGKVHKRDGALSCGSGGVSGHAKANPRRDARAVVP